MLPADILGLLRDWWKERPTGQDAGVVGPDRVIFPGYNGKHPSPRQISRLFKQAASRRQWRSLHAALWPVEGDIGCDRNVTISLNE